MGEGYDCLFTLRDVTGRDLLAKLPSVLEALAYFGSTPSSGVEPEAVTCPLPDGSWCKGGNHGQ